MPHKRNSWIPGHLYSAKQSAAFRTLRDGDYAAWLAAHWGTAEPRHCRPAYDFRRAKAVLTILGR